MRFQILCTLLTLTISSPMLSNAAWADAMHYTTLGARSGELQPPELTVRHLRMGQSAQAKETAGQARAGEQKTFEDVWQRYRALAEGRDYQETQKDTAPKETAMVPTQQRNNKPYTAAQRLTVTRPSAAGPDKPARPAAATPATLAAQEPAAGTERSPMPGYRETPLPEHITARPMGILDQYEQSKARRSQMKTLRINPPSLGGYEMPKNAPPPETLASGTPEMPASEVRHLKMHPPQMTEKSADSKTFKADSD